MTAVDARIPVHLSSSTDRLGLVGWLIEGDLPAPGPIFERFGRSKTHPIGCACCLPRSDAAQALGRLFLRRGRGEVWFDRVQLVADGESGRAAVAASLTGDVVVAARFRHEPG